MTNTIPVIGYNEDTGRFELIRSATTWTEACAICDKLARTFLHGAFDTGIEGKSYPQTNIQEWVDTAQTLSTYERLGYEDRDDYFQHLAEDYDVDLNFVIALATTLGPNEDFDGLPTMLADYVENGGTI